MNQYVILNRNVEGIIAASVISAESREMAVTKRAAQLKSYRREIIAVSSALPSEYGTGASYLYDVELEDIPVPTVIVKVKKAIKGILI